MKVIAGMATTNARKEFAHRAAESIYKQVTDIYIHNNDSYVDRADNGKYWAAFIYQKEPIYYLTLDDDIIYPQGYVDNMLYQIEKHKCIVSHHGRVLQGLTKDVGDYYTGHKAYAFFQENKQEIQLDVFGDGVAGYRTDYFNPKDMPFEKRLCMSDTLVSLEMWKQGKKAVLLTHGKYHIKPQRVPAHLTISGTRETRSKEKNSIADEIYALKKELYLPKN